MSDHTYLTAEAAARLEIDKMLVECGWVLQQESAVNLYASLGVAVREFHMAPGHGPGRLHALCQRQGRRDARGKEGQLKPGVAADAGVDEGGEHWRRRS